MSLHDEINKAIGAHGLWKQRLMAAIDSGKSEFTPDQVQHDDRCDFGKWLHGSTIAAATKQEPDYQSCCHLHAEFHREAANVLKLALVGQKDKAHGALTPGSKFGEISAALTRAMMGWGAKHPA